MEKQQELEWKAAQSIEISVDLVSAAKRQLKFLSTVDRNRWLYEGPGLDRAIYRYNACWLPLLAKHSASPLFEGPLVVPLDCEWIWHCHRLNPIRYRQDCAELYGRILDCKNVVSSLEGISSRPTEEMWKKLFPGETYELEFEHEDNVTGERAVGENWTKYDLVSAVQRQSPFFYQVSQPHMNDNRYLEGAVARYKGFLHVIKRNMEKGIKSFLSPTYDIDIIWHTHQLHPVSYCIDLVKNVGRILEHDDTDSDRTKGQKLDVAFSETIENFEGLYGRRYWRAGAMYTGIAPSPVRLTPYSGNDMEKMSSPDESLKLSLPATEVFEVMLEFVGVRNLPEQHNENLCVSFSKSQPDMIFKDKRILRISSDSGEKQVASFKCQPRGNLLFELMSTSTDSSGTKLSTTIGTTSMSLEDLLSPEFNLMAEKWLDLVPSSDIKGSKPVGLRVAISVTTPTAAPYTLHMARSHPVEAPLPKKWTSVVDEHGNVVLNLQMRNLRKPKDNKGLRKRVLVGIMETGKPRVLAAFVGSKWSMVDSPWSLKLPNADNDDGHFLEMTGPHTVRLFSGGKLDYELNRSEKHQPHLITAVKFSADEPYGTAVASLDMKSGIVKVKEEWFLLPALIVAFTIGCILRDEGCKEACGEGCGNMAKSGVCVDGSGGICVVGGADNISKSGVCVVGSGGICVVRGSENMSKSGVCVVSGSETMTKGGVCVAGSGGICVVAGSETKTKSGVCVVGSGGICVVAGSEDNTKSGVCVVGSGGICVVAGSENKTKSGVCVIGSGGICVVAGSENKTKGGVCVVGSDSENMTKSGVCVVGSGGTGVVNGSENITKSGICVVSSGGTGIVNGSENITKSGICVVSSGGTGIVNGSENNTKSGICVVSSGGTGIVNASENITKSGICVVGSHGTDVVNGSKNITKSGVCVVGSGGICVASGSKTITKGGVCVVQTDGTNIVNGSENMAKSGVCVVGSGGVCVVNASENITKSGICVVGTGGTYNVSGPGNLTKSGVCVVGSGSVSASSGSENIAKGGVCVVGSGGGMKGQNIAASEIKVA